MGKTCICQSLENSEYYDCELPSVRQQLSSPEVFLKSNQNKCLILDEVHRLSNPSETLKIAADHFPNIRIIATGSSTLGASSKFKDTLTGRKTEIWLTPMLFAESALFENENIQHRFLHGGLPPFFMAQQLPESEFQEWIDSYWAKDIQELFRLEKRHSFQKFLALLLAQSGGIFEASRFATLCEVSRTSISNYLAVLEATFVMHVIRPFSKRLATEIIAAPKIYGFDTGFVCYAKGWGNLRADDFGLMWEHCVLNEIQGRLQTRNVYYWRDKQQHEIDFIYIKNRNQNAPIAIECKWNSANFDPENFKIFRKRHAKGLNFVVSYDVTKSFEQKHADLTVTFVSIDELVAALQVNA